MNHYVYILISETEEKYYIGVRSTKLHPNEDPYMGSSSVMTKEDKDSCDKLVLEVFDTRAAAVAYEIELHERMNVVADARFWNCAKQTAVGFDTTGRAMSDEEKARRGAIQKERFEKYGHPNKGRTPSAETIEKLRKVRTGKTRSEAAKQKMSKAATGINNSAFVPWWYELDGIRTEVYDKTPKEVAMVLGVPYHVLKDRFRVKYAGKAKQSEPLKGLLVGRIHE